MTECTRVCVGEDSGGDGLRRSAGVAWMHMARFHARMALRFLTRRCDSSHGVAILHARIPHESRMALRFLTRVVWVARQ
eukprot:gene12702-biopygen18508